MVRTTPEYFWLVLELFYPYIQLLRVILALNIFRDNSKSILHENQLTVWYSKYDVRTCLHAPIAQQLRRNRLYYCNSYPRPGPACTGTTRIRHMHKIENPNLTRVHVLLV